MFYVETKNASTGEKIETKCGFKTKEEAEKFISDIHKLNDIATDGQKRNRCKIIERKEA